MNGKRDKNARLRINAEHYLVIDVEATCAAGGQVPRDEMEIIEIGAVLLDAKTLDETAEFETFIRPVRHPMLTEFCTELTTITQADVDDAPRFADAMASFAAWLEPFESYTFCSWGDYDRKQFQQDCVFHDVTYPLGEKHLNLKAATAKALHLRKPKGVGGMLRQVGLEFQGTPHRALADAQNIARILRRVLTGTRS